MSVLTVCVDRVLATLTSFTRFPFWRLKKNICGEAYAHVVPLWPLAGWLTGGMMALAFWLASLVFPLPIAVVCAIAVRLLATGTMHEDGLADFADGMGGGTSRERTLAIMKDSHIGTYGVITLIVYFLLLVLTLVYLGQSSRPLYVCLLCADPLAKYAASFVVGLPYARNSETAKNKLVYATPNVAERFAGFVLGLAPALVLMPYHLWPVLCAPFAVVAIMMDWMRRRLGGYTGDCCGATCLTAELTCLLALLATASLHI